MFAVRMTLILIFALVPILILTHGAYIVNGSNYLNDSCSRFVYPLILLHIRC